MGSKLVILAAILVSQAALASFPPTTVKDSLDTDPETTFNFEFPHFTGSHDGITYTLGVNGIAGGGTGQTTANAALNALLPSQATHAGKFLQTDGTNTSWVASSGTGTVTNVTSSDGSLDITNPITTPDIKLHFPIAGDGTAAAPDYGTPGGGMFGVSFGVIGFSTLGNEQFRIENNGDVVVGPDGSGTLYVNGPIIATGNLTAANYPPTGGANSLARFNNSGVLDSSLWGIDPDQGSLSMITSPGASSVSDFWQLRAQHNLAVTNSGVTRSTWFSLFDNSSSSDSLVGASWEFGIPVTNSATLLNLSASNATTVGGNLHVMDLATDSPVTGDFMLVNAGTTNTVGGNFTGYYLNDGTTTTGQKILYSGSHYGSVGTDLWYLNVNGSGNTGNTFTGVGMNNSGTVGTFSTGFGYSQSGDVTKGMLGVNIFADANVGDGSGVNLTFFNGSTSSGKTIDGNLNGVAIFNQATLNAQSNGFLFSNNASHAGFDGVSIQNSGAMSGNNTITGFSVNNSGTGYRFTGSNINNTANQTEEIRGGLWQLQGDSRTKTGLDLTMSGNATDDAQGVRVNVTSQTSSSTTQHVASGQFSGGTFSIQSQFTPFNGTTGPVDVGNVFTMTSQVQSGAPLTSVDVIHQLHQTNFIVDDDAAVGPIGLGQVLSGQVNQVQLASGKTIDSMTSHLVGFTFPSGSGGTVTDAFGLRVIGGLSFGGSATITNLVALSDFAGLGQELCDGRTNCWFIRNYDQDAQNSLSRLALGSTTTATGVKLEVNDGHVRSTQTTPPSATPDANAGTGATCSVSGATDSAGTIQLVTGSASWAAGAQCAVTFNAAYGTAPKCQITPSNANAAMAALNLYATKTTTDLVLNFVNPETAATTYEWDYSCVETQ